MFVKGMLRMRLSSHGRAGHLRPASCQRERVDDGQAGVSHGGRALIGQKAAAFQATSLAPCLWPLPRGLLCALPSVSLARLARCPPSAPLPSGTSHHRLRAATHRQTSTLHHRPRRACPYTTPSPLHHHVLRACLRALSLSRCISTRGHSPALQLPAAGVVRSGSWPEKARPRSNVKSFRPQHRTLQSTQHHNIPPRQGIPRPVAIHFAPPARPSLYQICRPPPATPWPPPHLSLSWSLAAFQPCARVSHRLHCPGVDFQKRQMSSQVPPPATGGQQAGMCVILLLRPARTSQLRDTVSLRCHRNIANILAL